jgi:predicted Rossmann-fold nucleotide-binding protein
MLAENPDALVIAFPGGHGTADCIKQAKELGMKIVEVGKE